jgi:hypothetical protein
VRVSNNVGIGFNAADSFGGEKGVIFVANAETAGYVHDEEGRASYE